jgi:hypothetical protein
MLEAGFGADTALTQAVTGESGGDAATEKLAVSSGFEVGAGRFELPTSSPPDRSMWSSVVVDGALEPFRTFVDDHSEPRTLSPPLSRVDGLSCSVRTLDVREEEGDRAGGKVVTHR